MATTTKQIVEVARGELKNGMDFVEVFNSLENWEEHLEDMIESYPFISLISKILNSYLVEMLKDFKQPNDNINLVDDCVMSLGELCEKMKI
jgi:hypothetical protein